MIEANYALRVEQQAIRRGSGGAGAHRGGDGVVRRYRVLAEEMWLTACVERCVVPPYGLKGGEPGLPYRVTLLREGAATPIRGKANLRLRRDDVVMIETSGGGGFGPAEAG